MADRPSPRGRIVGHGRAGEDAADRDTRYARMFDRPAADTSDDAIVALVTLIAKQTAKSDNTTIPAGFTYLGQFIDHDLTFDPTPLSTRGPADDRQAPVNVRTPRFDLDSVYGSGPADQPYLYEWKNAADRGVKLLLGSGENGVADLPRNDEGLALTGDPRNDENLIVSQLHLLFVRFHNAAVEYLRARPAPTEPDALFDTARELVRWHYQWIVMHDFLRRIVGRTMAADVLREGPAKDAPATVVRRFFRWRDRPSIPVEFSGAAYRFGHSMVRPSYRVKAQGAVPSILPPQGASPSDADLSGFRPLPAALELDWDLFFWSAAATDTNISRRINNRISAELFAVPGRGSLPHLNLLRGRRLGLPSGQEVADAMRAPRIDRADLQLGAIPASKAREELLAATPLWYYILCEAGTERHGCGGAHLGPVGGRIVAEVLAGLLEGDRSSYLSKDPAWRPMLPSAVGGDFTMMDLVDFVLGRPPRPPISTPA